ncbi:MAG: hypothetical protein JST00_00890 [Deltaproteobacteria bacterium]|nr:hypothetical protein [Deltaproteobacteria bacterium]
MRTRTVLVSMFVLAGCRRAPPPEPRAVAATASAIAIASVPESSATPDASLEPRGGGAPDAAPGECADSSECRAGAICCMKARELPTKQDPTRPFSDVTYEHHAVCTTNPAQDCDTLELCKGASCRRPRPKAQLRCGGLTCAEPTPRCVLDVERAPGEKARPPMCIGDDRDAEASAPSSSWLFSCTKSEDCPRGAHCALRHRAYGATTDAECAFKPPPPAHGLTTAPMCREPSECAKLVEGYRGPNTTGPSRCRPLRGAPSMRACEVDGNEGFF